jgi:hypothetical protein
MRQELYSNANLFELNLSTVDQSTYGPSRPGAVVPALLAPAATQSSVPAGMAGGERRSRSFARPFYKEEEFAEVVVCARVTL